MVRQPMLPEEGRHGMIAEAMLLLVPHYDLVQRETRNALLLCAHCFERWSMHISRSNAVLANAVSNADHCPCCGRDRVLYGGEL